MRLFGRAVCRFSRMLRSCVEQALRLGHVAAPHRLLHLLEHAVEVVLGDDAVRARAGSAVLACWLLALHALGELAQELVHAPGAARRVRRLISSFGAPRSMRLAQALLRGAQLALGVGQVAVLDLQRHRPEPVGDLEEICVGLRPRAAGRAPSAGP